MMTLNDCVAVRDTAMCLGVRGSDEGTSGVQERATVTPNCHCNLQDYNNSNRSARQGR